jgi:hypothetical protein
VDGGLFDDKSRSFGEVDATTPDPWITGRTKPNITTGIRASKGISAMMGLASCCQKKARTVRGILLPSCSLTQQ